MNDDSAVSMGATPIPVGRTAVTDSSSLLGRLLTDAHVRYTSKVIRVPNQYETPSGRYRLHTLIASPFLADYLVLRPDDRRTVRIDQSSYFELLSNVADSAAVCPRWLVDAARNGGISTLTVNPSSARCSFVSHPPTVSGEHHTS